MGRSGDKASTASVSYRRADDLTEVTREWSASRIDEIAAAAPWRTFRWYRRQKHYSGTYWSSTVGGHIIYESRLELGRLLFADFDARVRHIVAQPFLLRTLVDRKPRKHIPDYLLITETGPVVLDVKPARRYLGEELGGLAAATPEIAILRYTLHHFLRNGSRYIETANALYIQRNTVADRIKRAENRLFADEGVGVVGASLSG